MIIMSLNVGYLKSSKNDEAYTPYYAVQPLLKYIPKNVVIWCPFDQDYSAFVNLLRNHGCRVICSHIELGYDFFNYEPRYYDIIISNPPFSIKDKVLERLYQLNKPFAMLLPLNSIQGVKRYEYFKHGIQLLAFDQRIGFHNIESMDTTIESSPFASAYFCRDLLPRDLILEHLEKFDRPLRRQMVRLIDIRQMCYIIK